MTVLTIRARLTLWYALAFFAVLLCVLGLLVLELYQQLDDEVHRALDGEEAWVATLVEADFLPISLGAQKSNDANNDSLFADLPEDLDERYDLKRQFAFLRIAADDEQLLFSGGLKKLLPEGFLDRTAGNYDVIIDGNRYRVRVFHREWGSVAIGVENEMLFKAAEKTAGVFVWVVPVAVLLAIGGGWLLARLALRPVVAAAHAAESISITNLENRLPAYSGTDEFGTLVLTLNRMIARLEDGVKRLQQFTEDAAHELRTPLAILRGDLDLVSQQESSPEETEALLHRTLDRVIALGRIVDNLMLLARSDSGTYLLQKTRFRLDAVVREILEDVQILAEAKTLTVQLQACEALEFFGDELLIRRLVMNLCDNALKYTSRGEIILTLQEAENTTTFTIRDTGEGISSKDLPKIFDRFYRVDKSRSKITGGSGLGLAICKWIVTAHNGEITINSVVGKGTTVCVRFPNA